MALFRSITLLLIFICSVKSNSKCVIDSTDFSLLDGSLWESFVSSDNTFYKISLCKSINDSGNECDNSSVCMKDNDKWTKIVPFDSELFTVTDSTRSGMFWLSMEGVHCKGVRSRRIIINFKCGPTLGSPEFSIRTDCDVYFTWKSVIACKKIPPTKQVPCYTYDRNHTKYDLSPLMKSSSGYKITTVVRNTVFMINVCSSITSDDVKDNSSAVFVIGKDIYSFGKPSSPLTIVSGGEDNFLQLVYESNNDTLIPPGCTSLPKTTINFICPQFGMGEAPRIISLENCNYVIEWVTQYACPKAVLEGDTKTCSFSRAINGVKLDLSPLKIESAPYYRVDTKLNDSNVSFLMNICGGLGSSFKCGGKKWATNAVCQINSDKNNSVLLGTTKEQTLRYCDGVLTLTYGNGNLCSSDNHVPLQTVITFECDPTVNGSGSPEFLKYKDCIYFFEWKTKYACTAEANQCSIMNGNAVIDLKVLTRSKKAWNAINGPIFHNKNENRDIYVNVCDFLPQEERTGSCPRNSFVCLVVNGTGLSLGRRMEILNYNNYTGETVLKYDNGDKCESGRSIKSTITLICKPGDLESGPVFARISSDGCHYEFIWYTAAACVQGKSVGSDCQVYNDELGISFNLKPLQKLTAYEVDHGNYMYYINVCKAAKGTPCKETDSAACQVKKGQEKSSFWNMGKVSSKLIYQNGFLTLEYDDGQYYSHKKYKRKTLITFLCDHHAGIGEPTFINEDNNVYVFNWFTSFACPSVPLQCITEDPNTGEQYDLSRLDDVWSSVATDNGRKYKLYVSICRTLPVTKVPHDCDFRASSCITEFINNEEKVIVSNAGQLSNPPKLNSDGRISLTYTNGSACTMYSKEMNATTVIHFTCNKGELTNGPVLMSKIGPCEYMATWSTKEACPIKELEVKNKCIVTDPLSGYTYNLTGLTKDSGYYLVTDSSTMFQINICGEATGSDCSESDKKADQPVSVCKKSGKKGKTIGLLSTMKLEYLSNGIITIIYSGSNDKDQDKSPKVVIRIRCDQNVKLEQPMFIRFDEDENTYLFELKTVSACGPKLVDCIFNDIHGNQYDLTPLARKEYTNWLVKDPRQGHRNLIYHINVCRPLVKDSAFHCPAEPIGACQTSLSLPTSEGLNLGFIKSEPEATSNGTVVLRYTEGSPCHDGQYKRSTKIIFVCSHKEQTPVFVGETPECEYIFSWETPAGCPLQREPGSDCRVSDPLFGSHFDLNPLKNLNKDYEVNTGDYTYLLNVCKPLVGGTGPCVGAGVCQTKKTNKFIVNAGKFNEKLLYDDGHLVLEYIDGRKNCHKKYERKSIITFMCDHDAIHGKSKPTYIKEADDCTYHFEWKTNLACPTHVDTGCAFSHDGNGYDLSSLSITDDNHYVSSPEMPGIKFVINVCRTIVPRKGSVHCPYSAGACMIKLDESKPNKRYKSIGSVNFQTFPEFRDGKMILEYKHGDYCMSSKSNKPIYSSTIIQLICDKTERDTQPQFQTKDASGCVFRFTWKTSAACAVNDEVQTNDNCVATNINTGYKFDLRSLKKKNGYEVRTSNGHRFLLNVCDKLDDNNKCGNKSGACQLELSGTRSWNAGNYNSNLHYHNGILMLNYTDGNSCRRDRYKRNTIIEFVCGDSNSIGPIFIDESDDCTYFFMWHTPLACETQVNCQTESRNDSNIDFSSLIKSSLNGGFHYATSTVDSAAYYINVCRPLNPISGVRCPAGSSICRDDGKGNPLSLGRSLLHPMNNFQGNPIMIFSEGSKCPFDRSHKISSVVNFICSYAHITGHPILTGVDKCVYKFEWETSLVCSLDKPQISHDCVFSDEKFGISINLTELMRTVGGGYTVKTNNDVSFELNVCSQVPGNHSTICSKSSVCMKKKGIEMASYGSVSNYTFEFMPSSKQLKLKYSDGSYCAQSVTGKSSTEIHFSCNAVAGIGRPKLFSKYACLAVFEWETSAVCGLNNEECIVTNKGKTYDLTLLSSLSKSWKTTDEHGNQYWLNICNGIHDSPNSVTCPPSAAACYKPAKEDRIYMLGATNSQMISFIDDNRIQLLYNDGVQDACKYESRSDRSFSSAKIILFCSNKTENPKLISRSENNCQFVFHWNTTQACLQERVLLAESSGIVDLPLFGTSLNFTKEIYGSFEVIEKKRIENYVYLISLTSVHPKAKTTCEVSGVCQTTDKGFSRDIGTKQTKKFYLKGSELQLTLTSMSSKCGKFGNGTVKTHIFFSCSKQFYHPKFLYESKSCDYVFTWQTPAACIDLTSSSKIVSPSSGPTSKKVDDISKEVSSYTSVIVFVIILLLLIIILIGVLYKKERRENIWSGMKRCCRSTKIPTFHYSKRSGEEDVLLANATIINTDQVDS